MCTVEVTAKTARTFHGSRCGYPGGSPYDGHTDIEVSEQAREFVAQRGGTLFLRVRHNRCCSGGLTFLDASTSAHRDGDHYEIISRTSPEVRLFRAGSVLPEKVSVEMRGKLRPHLVAYWDGCAFRL
jgi:hypothetical protein